MADAPRGMASYLRSLRAFAPAILRWWWFLIPGLAAGADYVTHLSAGFLPRGYQPPVSGDVGVVLLLAGGLVLAAFFAFHDEHVARERLEARLNSRTPNQLAQEANSLISDIGLAGAKVLHVQTENELIGWMTDEFMPVFVRCVTLVNAERAVYLHDLLDALNARPDEEIWPQAVMWSRIWEARCSVIEKALRKMLRSIRYD